MSQLAIDNGPPVRTTPWPQYPVFGEEEKRAVCRVIDSNHLVAHLAGVIAKTLQYQIFTQTDRKDGRYRALLRITLGQRFLDPVVLE